MGQLSHRPGSHPAATGDRPRFIRDGWHQHHPCTHAKGLVQVSSCCSQDPRHRALAVAWPLAHPMGWGLQGSFHLPRALGPSRGYKHSLSFSRLWLTASGTPWCPHNPHHCPLSLYLLLSGCGQWLWGQGPEGLWPPHPPCGLPNQSHPPDTPVGSPGPGSLLRREGRNQQALGCGVLFHFIQVPLKRSLYKSAHEDAQETSPGLHSQRRMLHLANVHIYREPPEKKRGRRKSQAW